jgi:F-type H+-transporting ATPase subunit delta
MRQATIAKNYAEALLVLAGRAKDLGGWGSIINGLSDAIRQDATLRAFLETPKVPGSMKAEILGKALAKKAPVPFIRFIQSAVRNRRQMLIPEIAIEYMDLVDKAENRLHAHVTVARDADEKTRKMIADRLSKILNKTVVPHLTVDARIIGGVIVRVGDTVMDGSARRRLASLRSRMLGR